MFLSRCWALKHMVKAPQQGALTICTEARIPSDKRGIVELTAFHSSHYQLENEPLQKKMTKGSC